MVAPGLVLQSSLQALWRGREMHVIRTTFDQKSPDGDTRWNYTQEIAPLASHFPPRAFPSISIGDVRGVGKATRAQ